MTDESSPSTSDLESLAAPYVTLDPEQVSLFDRYRQMLISWNDRFNLTAITEPDEIDRRLFLDALRMVPALDEAIARTGAKAMPRLADLGAGAGFPGLPLKIARPDLDVTLVEATGKKVRFLEAVISELRLDHAAAVHARAEEVGQDRAYRGRFDLVTARAVASLSVLFELAAPLLRIGGIALFPKGSAIGEELAYGIEAAKIVGLRVESADFLPASETRLVIATKIGETPRRYPRRPGLPNKEPLGGKAPPPPPARRPAGDEGNGPTDPGDGPATDDATSRQTGVLWRS